MLYQPWCRTTRYNDSDARTQIFRHQRRCCNSPGIDRHFLTAIPIFMYRAFNVIVVLTDGLIVDSQYSGPDKRAGPIRTKFQSSNTSNSLIHCSRYTSRDATSLCEYRRENEIELNAKAENKELQLLNVCEASKIIF